MEKRAGESEAVPVRSFDVSGYRTVRPPEHRLFHVLKAPCDILSIEKRVRACFKWHIHHIHQELVKRMYIRLSPRAKVICYSESI